MEDRNFERLIIALLEACTVITILISASYWITAVGISPDNYLPVWNRFRVIGSPTICILHLNNFINIVPSPTTYLGTVKISVSNLSCINLREIYPPIIGMRPKECLIVNFFGINFYINFNLFILFKVQICAFRSF